MSDNNLAFANDGSFWEEFQKQQKQGAPQPAAVSSPQVPEPEKEAGLTIESFSGREFVAARSFQCGFEGYFFGTGSKGTGYYLDKPPKGLQILQKKGLLLKSKPIIPGLKAVGGVLKKGKAENGSSSKYVVEMERYRKQSCETDSSSGRPLVK